MVKSCNKCKVSKPLEDFYRAVKTYDGRDSVCKECKRLGANKLLARRRDKARYERNKGRVKARLAAREHYKDFILPCAIKGCQSVADNLHHMDYGKPLEVMPLCKEHHKRFHLIWVERI